MPRLSPEQHAAMAKCLREAREFLWDGTGTYPYGEAVRRVYVCHTLRATSVDQRTQTLCSNWIYYQLNGAVSYVGWLAKHGVTFENCGANSDSWRTFVQGGRLAWLDNMIKVLEE